MLRNQKGFTLIELIIVIVIIGILAAVAIPKFNTLDASAKSAACEKNKMNIQQAAVSYYGDTAIKNNGQGTWPADVAALIASDLLQDGSYLCPVDNASAYAIDGADGVVTCAGCDI